MFIRRKKLKKLRSSRPEMLCKKGVLKIFAKFTGKQLCHSLFFNKKIACKFVNKETLQKSTIYNLRQKNNLRKKMTQRN